jgi:hypothetical protein
VGRASVTSTGTGAGALSLRWRCPPPRRPGAGT